jgi:hypothetical protein
VQFKTSHRIKILKKFRLFLAKSLKNGIRCEVLNCTRHLGYPE